jgi:hypothetical protein
MEDTAFHGSLGLADFKQIMMALNYPMTQL